METKEFKDYDGIVHPIGETWKFFGKNFQPYENGLSMFVERDEKTVHFRIQWRSETQGEIISNFSDYVEKFDLVKTKNALFSECVSHVAGRAGFE